VIEAILIQFAKECTGVQWFRTVLQLARHVKGCRVASLVLSMAEMLKLRGENPNRKMLREIIQEDLYDGEVDSRAGCQKSVLRFLTGNIQ